MNLSVRDFLIPSRLLRAVEAVWPGDDWSGWHCYDDGKRASRSIETAPEAIKAALHQLACAATLFTPDAFPDLDCYAAGLHELPAGVGLPWHRDAARHPLRPWRRTETAILYLDGGGDLIFRGGTASQRVTPMPGRVVSFLPDELTEHCVEASTKRRRSLAVFFYVIDHQASGPVRAEFCPC